MSLAPGTRIGAYQIVTALGSGGPAFVRALILKRELRRGRAEAKPEVRS